MRRKEAHQRRRSGPIRGQKTHSQQPATWGYARALRFLGRDRSEEDLAWLGVGVPSGILAPLLNEPGHSLGQRFVSAYQQDGWPGLQVALALDDHLPDALKVRALLEAAYFARAGWAVDECTHPLPHPKRLKTKAPPLFRGTHWYIRPARGRRPLACFLVRETAKAYRARDARKARRLRTRRTEGRRREHATTRTR